MGKLGFELLAEKLGYEQGLFLENLCGETEPVELAGACQKADCSWAESYELQECGMIAIVADENTKVVTATITEYGKLVSETIKKLNEESKK